jgi:hypothetical protein
MAHRAFDSIQMELGSQLASSSASSLSITLKNGSRIEFVCQGNEARAFGLKPDFLVVDEAGRIDDYFYASFILRVLADGAEALIIGTPNGRNWFYKEWSREDAESSTHPSSERMDPDEIEHARSMLSPKNFAQEFMAEFVDAEPCECSRKSRTEA